MVLDDIHLMEGDFLALASGVELASNELGDSDFDSILSPIISAIPGATSTRKVSACASALQQRWDRSTRKLAAFVSEVREAHHDMEKTDEHVAQGLSQVGQSRQEHVPDEEVLQRIAQRLG